MTLEGLIIIVAAATNVISLATAIILFMRAMDRHSQELNGGLSKLTLAVTDAAAAAAQAAAAAAKALSIEKGRL